MIINRDYNWGLLTTILFLSMGSALSEGPGGINGIKGCSSTGACTGGYILGILSGIGWYYFMNSLGGNAAVYNNEYSNVARCSRPSKQQFRCNIMKNGKKVNKS